MAELETVATAHIPALTPRRMFSTFFDAKQNNFIAATPRYGSLRIARLGRAFIKRFHSLKCSRMNTSSVAGAVMVPSG